MPKFPVPGKQKYLITVMECSIYTSTHTYSKVIDEHPLIWFQKEQKRERVLGPDNIALINWWPL